MKSFWQNLPQPIIGLSPMDGVTDFPFRYITKKYGHPDVVYTEFTSVEGICHGAERLLKDFYYDESQRPIVGQIYGSTPEYFEEAAVILCELGFDGVDVNMGCPAKNVAHSGAGAALIQTPELAQDILRATKRGVAEFTNGRRARDSHRLTPKIIATVEKRVATQEAQRELQNQPTDRTKPVTPNIPVSVKTRIGYSHPVIDDWIPTLLETEPAAIALHGRTLKQQYSGFANWEEIGRAAAIIRQTPTLILGNGDVQNRADALTKISEHNLHGALIGRQTFGNPFIFSDQTYDDIANSVDRLNQILAIAVEHAHLFEQTYQNEDSYNFMPMRKHLGWYARGFPGASETRQRLFTTSTAAEVATILDEIKVS